MKRTRIKETLNEKGEVTVRETIVEEDNEVALQDIVKELRKANERTPVYIPYAVPVNPYPWYQSPTITCSIGPVSSQGNIMLNGTSPDVQ